MKFFASFLIPFCDSSNDLLQSASKNSLFTPVHPLKINPLKSNKLGMPRVISSEKETSNVSGTSFIIFVTGNS